LGNLRLGIGNYAESDVSPAARVFTGWNLQRPGSGTDGSQHWEFVYNGNAHDTGAKTFSFPVYPDGGTRFQGELPLLDGRTILDRTTLTPMKDGRVHQTIEDSKDGGTSWIAGFDAYYTRK